MGGCRCLDLTYFNDDEPLPDQTDRLISLVQPCRRETSCGYVARRLLHSFLAIAPVPNPWERGCGRNGPDPSGSFVHGCPLVCCQYRAELHWVSESIMYWVLTHGIPQSMDHSRNQI